MVEDEGVTARGFWIKVRGESLFVLYSPFFVCLASGNLDSQTFRLCTSQDVHVLNAFARAYELAEDCAGDDDDRNAIRDLRKGVLEKLKTRDSLVQEWGFEVSKESAPSDSTVKITDFLVATASGKIEGEKVPGNFTTPFERTKLAAYTLGAIAPCMRLYVFISKEILATLDPDDTSNVYKKWVESYSSQHFEESVLQTEDLLDRLSASLTGDELKVIEKLYHQAMKLEVDFFSAQPIIQQSIVPLSRVHDSMAKRLTVFCDFDLTCTTVDSSAILAEMAIVTAPRAEPDGSETHLNRLSLADLRTTWRDLSRQFTEEFEQCIESIIQSELEMAIVTAPRAEPDGSETHLNRLSLADLRTTWGDLSRQFTEEFEQCIESITQSESVKSFNYDGLKDSLKNLADFEKRANSRVVQSGVLKGLNFKDIKRVGQLLVLQDGCKGFFQKILGTENMKTDVHILSYCWCGDLIRSAFSSGELETLEVHSNELCFEDSICTGEITEKVQSPLEKLETFNQVVQGHSNTGDRQLTVYIGGSVGDLLCLLEADIGMVFGSNPSLNRLADHYGVTFVPLFPDLVKKQKEVEVEGQCKWNKLSGILYTVSSWAEIEAFIVGS